ncbi:bifunctional UDP-N-acetylmuramoyl-tripeptide:D-alanyl-D-alanine ligase/alanine racemase [Puteibacter caeruleilacunae]|nr:bifunctional UDP-N-acetylmuramoyl-tripeptide:D-alanyl-D-alanine ligase/alanine racemase [Puteibacter caeruleilacunae]
MEYSIEEIKSILVSPSDIKGNLSANYVRYIVIDTRTILDGSKSIFFALKGPNNDGHSYIKNAYSKGVRCFVVRANTSIAEEYSDAVFIQVDDTLKALQKLTTYHRQRFLFPVIGITGSNGKTVVKEWLFELLQEKYRIVRSPKSYNSQVGVPLSVWMMDADYDLGIFEAGISCKGEMNRLTSIVNPTIGIFTNITSAHQENFTSYEEKIREKLKLFERCEILIYRRGNQLINREVSNFASAKGVTTLSWSNDKDTKADIHIVSAKDKGGCELSYISNISSGSIWMPFADRASIENASHCITLLLAMEMNPRDFLGQFRELQPVAMRLEIKQGINSCVLINDSYNSDVNSLSIALDLLENKAVGINTKKTLILSDINQSGLKRKQLYTEVARLLKLHKIDRIIGIGSEIMILDKYFDGEKEFYRTTTNFIDHFREGNFDKETILIKGARSFEFDLVSDILQKKVHQTVLEVNLSAVQHNLNCFRRILEPGVKIMAMVKAFSYGSGSVEIAQALQYHQVDYLAVAIADEGVELRKAGVIVPIVVMNPEEHSFALMIEYKLEPNIYSLELLKSFNKVVEKSAANLVPIHLKLETGMKRLGIDSEEELQAVIDFIKERKNLFVRSIFSHLAVSDEVQQDEFTCQQINCFKHLSNMLVDAFDYKVLRHVLNSAGIERFSDSQFDMVRLGIGLYGVSIKPDRELKTVSTLKTTISQIREVSPGESIGYGRKGNVEVPSQIAIIPIGYADGLSRRYGNGRYHVCVNGQRVPIIGNICMDMCMIDVTGCNVKVGDQVEIFGEHCRIEDMALCGDTIPYEILTSVSQRVKRVYYQE